MLRVLPPTLCVAGLASLAVGCGGGGSVNRAYRTPPISRQAKAYARAVNLRAADVPGMTKESAEASIGNGVPLGALDRCLGGLGRSELADAPILSAWFIAPKTRISMLGPRGVAKAMTPPGERIYSEIDVMRSQALALREVAALGTTRARVCLKNHPRTSHGAPPISHAEVYPLSAALAGPSVTGLRMAGTLPPGASHTSEAFSTDVIAMASGRSVIVLHIIAWRRAFPVTTEQHLLSLLQQRAKEHQV
jgi:hypothetical protein